MEWIEGLNKAISYIEEHLTEEISYDELACMPNSCLRIVDSNGKPRDTTIYEIPKICEELNSGTLSYIDVYNKTSTGKTTN